MEANIAQQLLALGESPVSPQKGEVIPPRKSREFIPDNRKDAHYWERRRKNNEAAKRSREKRRMNDMVLEGKISELTDENQMLRDELIGLKKRFGLPLGNLAKSRSSSPKLESNGVQQTVSPTPTTAVPQKQTTSSTSCILSNSKTKTPEVSKPSPQVCIQVPRVVPQQMIQIPGQQTLALVSSIPYPVNGQSSEQTSDISVPTTQSSEGIDIQASAAYAVQTDNKAGMMIPGICTWQMVPAHLMSEQGNEEEPEPEPESQEGAEGAPLNLVIKNVFSRANDDSGTDGSNPTFSKDEAEGSDVEEDCVVLAGCRDNLTLEGSKQYNSQHYVESEHSDSYRDSDNESFSSYSSMPKRLRIDESDTTETSLLNDDLNMPSSIGKYRCMIDPKYAERRKRNNEAARKCRENRKMAMRARTARSNLLEAENDKLKNELLNLSDEVKSLKQMIESKKGIKHSSQRYPVKVEKVEPASPPPSSPATE
jgi:hypothetical protein